MAEGGGLFSGLKFTDVLFPALAAGASMYNPYIGRGIQTGLNTFNTFADFQNSARYYKRLKEEQDRMAAGLESGHGAIDRHVGRLQGRMSEYMGRSQKEFGPLLDEEQTSQFGIFGDEGPELPDPEQETLIMQALEDAAGAEQQGQLGLGMEGIENPRFSEMMAADLPGQIAIKEDLTDAQLAEQRGLESQIWDQELAGGLLDAAPGAAANQSLMAAYRGMDSDYRDADRIKDLQYNFDLREDAAKRELLERQLQLQQVKDIAGVHRAEQVKHEAWADRYAANQRVGTDGQMTQAQADRMFKSIGNDLVQVRDPDTTDEQAPILLERAIKNAIVMMKAGLQPPAEIMPFVEEYIKNKDNAALAGLDPGGGTNQTVVSHRAKTAGDQMLKDIGVTNPGPTGTDG